MKTVLFEKEILSFSPRKFSVSDSVFERCVLMSVASHARTFNLLERSNKTNGISSKASSSLLAIRYRKQSFKSKIKVSDGER